MKIEELLKMSIEELTTIERAYWQKWELMRQLLKVVKKMVEEE